MSLEQLCQEIEQKAAKDAHAIIKEAETRAKEIESNAEEASDLAITSAREEAYVFSKEEAAEKIAATILEAQKLLSEAKEEAVRANMELVWDAYKSQAKRAGYAKKLRQWADLAMSEIGSGAVLKTNSVDKPVLSKIGYRVSQTPIDCAGGVRAETSDGRISVDYTLEAQFERKREEISREVYQRLFADMEEPNFNALSESRSAKKPARKAAKKAARKAGKAAKKSKKKR